MANQFIKDHYRPLTGLAVATSILYGVLAVLSLLTATLGFAYAGFHREPFSPDQSGPLAPFLLLLGLFVQIEILFRISAIVLLLIWMFCAYRNLRLLATKDLAYSPGWTIGAWFIPFANLVIPVLVMRELWQASEPELENNSPFNRAKLGTPDAMGFWWPLWIVSSIALFASNILLISKDRHESPLYPGVLSVGCITRAAAAILLILVVRDITSRQARRFAWLNSTGHSAVPPPPPQFQYEDRVSSGLMPDQQQRQQEDPNPGHEVPEQSNHAASRG